MTTSLLFDEELKAVEAELFDALAGIPNIPDADVPIGVDDKDTFLPHRRREKVFRPNRAHWDLGPAGHSISMAPWDAFTSLRCAASAPP